MIEPVLASVLMVAAVAWGIVFPRPGTDVAVSIGQAVGRALHEDVTQAVGQQGLLGLPDLGSGIGADHGVSSRGCRCRFSLRPGPWPWRCRRRG